MWTILFCFPGCFNRELDQKWCIWDLNQHMYNVSSIHVSLTHCATMQTCGMYSICRQLTKIPESRPCLMTTSPVFHLWRQTQMSGYGLRVIWVGPSSVPGLKFNSQCEVFLQLWWLAEVSIWEVRSPVQVSMVEHWWLFKKRETGQMTRKSTPHLMPPDAWFHLKTASRGHHHQI